MNICSLVPIDELVARLGITYGTGRLADVVFIAYAAMKEFIHRYGFSADEVIRAMRGAINGSRYSNLNTVRLLFMLASEPRASQEVIEQLFRELRPGGNRAWGALFVVEFLDITGLWDIVRRLEGIQRVATGRGTLFRIYDIVLTTGHRFELKNWWVIWDGYWRSSHARTQLIRDLIRGSFEDTFWVFSRGLPVNTQDDFYEWFIREADDVVRRWKAGQMSDVPGLTSELADRVQRNWDALKANDAERLRARVIWLSPEEIRSLRSNEEQISLIERMLIEDGILSPR